MTPDGNEFYFGASMGGFHYATIAYTKLVDGQWTEPEIVDFCRDGRYLNAEPHITPDGNKLLFLSTRPDPNEPGDEDDQDIWAVDRVGDGWGEPYNLGAPVNTKGGEFFPSVTNDGTLYFTRSPEGTRENYIYRSRLVDGVYQEPEKLAAPVNVSPLHFNAFIAPDESYLIVPTTREDTLGGIDYYIFFPRRGRQVRRSDQHGPDGQQRRRPGVVALRFARRQVLLLHGRRQGWQAGRNRPAELGEATRATEVPPQWRLEHLLGRSGLHRGIAPAELDANPLNGPHLGCDLRETLVARTTCEVEQVARAVTVRRSESVGH